ncbi:Peroxisomal adenine nucleotide carrier 1 [Symbiodinium microadriaticum]|uniref:Peroxisomal adenine nucleotide carrier 1 n=1 Tax=Symbiodinium microadriaticum TaxID=2951 RepID=A0A1Q9DLD4_SYMMI|nr:Peroxisomal adenine nucleotide carrier 1 [Symbiodinium microadriaticum]
MFVAAAPAKYEEVAALQGSRWSLPRHSSSSRRCGDAHRCCHGPLNLPGRSDVVLPHCGCKTAIGARKLLSSAAMHGRELLAEGITGGLGGLVGRCASFPFDTLKVKLATSSTTPRGAEPLEFCRSTMQGAVMMTLCAWSFALLGLRVEAVLVRRAGDEPEKLRDVEAIAPFGDKADGLSRPHVELVNKSGVVVQALDECICGFGTFWDSIALKCVPQLTKGVTCGGFAPEDWPLTCQDGLTCKLPPEFNGKVDREVMKKATCLDCAANDGCQLGRQMCQRVFAVSGQACVTVKVTVPQAKATMSVTKNVTVKAISTKNAHATAKETATVSQKSVEEEATESASAEIPNSNRTQKATATRSATASAVVTGEATADINVPYTQSAIRTSTKTRSAEGYAQGSAYATACSSPEGPLRTPDAQAAAATAAYALEKAFRQAANFALRNAKAAAMADAKRDALTQASKEAFEAAKDAASEVAKAAAISKAAAGVKAYGEWKKDQMRKSLSRTASDHWIHVSRPGTEFYKSNAEVEFCHPSEQQAKFRTPHIPEDGGGIRVREGSIRWAPFHLGNYRETWTTGKVGSQFAKQKDHAEEVAEQTAKARAVAAAKEAAEQVARKEAQKKASKLAEEAAQEKAERLAKRGGSKEETEPEKEKTDKDEAKKESEDVAKKEEAKKEEDKKEVKKEAKDEKEEDTKKDDKKVMDKKEEDEHKKEKAEKLDKEDMFAKWTADDALEKEAAKDKKAADKEAAAAAKEAAKEEEKKEAMDAFKRWAKEGEQSQLLAEAAAEREAQELAREGADIIRRMTMPGGLLADEVSQDVSFLALFKRVLSEEGVAGLYRGLFPFSALEAMEQKALYVLNYTALKALLRRLRGREPGLLATVLLGYISDLLCVPISIPMEALVVQLQTAPPSSSKSEIVHKALFTREGLRAAVKSGSAYFVVSLKPGIEFALFDWLKSKILNAGHAAAKDLPPLLAFLLGALARGIATCFVYPYVRGKALAQAKLAPSASAALQNVFFDEGPLALYRGLSMEIMRGMTQSAVMFAVMEKIRSEVKWRLAPPL